MPYRNITFQRIMHTITSTSFLVIFTALSWTIAAASDRSDATTLREKCEAEFKHLEIVVKNFGSESDVSGLQKGIDLLKTGKVKLAQSKYLDAKAIYNDYLKLQSEIYKSLASSYSARTEAMINEITAELVDFLDNEKISQSFRLAAQNLNDAKSSEKGERYKMAVDLCRNAKKFVIDSYKQAGKNVPDKYRKDAKDNDKQIYTEK